MKNLLKYSIFFGLVAIIIIVLIYLYTPNTRGSDAMGNGIADGYNTIGFMIFIIPYSLIIIFSFYKFLMNQSEFENKSIWTIIHIVPFLFAVWYLVGNYILQPILDAIQN
ncbi:hypothetical protein M4I21_16645 [Cellulophaga sp. 20_2_10]|uniref:hypothetical protein n=1 Tax=Cellulophaga sp. 20_2_10 TaxID=2942476 RepID=UPI00201B236D|nr:hypothetical protein [Cellulophaga sp. 20_2_10]MCL5247451.1 hypothetical protein [Cellulophaga sp. 20_2_10]